MNGSHECKPQDLVLALVTPALLGGCGEASTQMAPQEQTAQLSRVRTCAPFSLQDPAPAAGTLFEYSGTYKGDPSPVRLLQIMRRKRHGQQGFRERMYYLQKDSAAKDDLRKYAAPETSIGGILSWEKHRPWLAGEYQVRTFSTNPARAIAALKQGDSISIPSVETSKLGGIQKIISEPITIKYLGCRTLDITGQPLDTSIYQVNMTSRAFRRSLGEDKPVSNTYRVYYSAKRGWWVRNETKSGTVQLAGMHTP